MHEATKDCIKRSIAFYEDELKRTNHFITQTTETLANLTEKKMSC